MAFTDSFKVSFGGARRLATPLASLATILLVGMPVFSEAPSPPPYYAIHDVRVVTGTGSVLESATVLIADGLIEAVGTNVTIPEDAWSIDGQGLSLYPGMIDGLGNLGQVESEGGEGRGGRGSSQPAPAVRGPEDRPATEPWIQAADKLGNDERIENWREAGFTSAVTAPGDGLFAGEAAVVNLGRSEPRDRVVAASVAQRLNFSGASTYPRSLMGALSYIGQVLSDTRHYTKVKAAYEADPLGKERPTHDLALEALETALAARRPFLMPADLGREIDRALMMARRWQVRPILYGVQAGYAEVDALANANVSVLVDLKWPEEATGRDPEADTDFRTLYHRQLAPTTPQVLAESGVLFGFTSSNPSSPSEFLEGVRAAVEAGLSEDAALAALTRNPAQMFGVDSRLGTIEPGKIANLVLASDAPWAEGVEVTAVFVDGRKYQERKDDSPQEPPASDVSGTWALRLETPGGTKDLTIELEMSEEGGVTGELTSERGTSSLEDGRMSADLLSFDVTRTMGTRSMESSYALTVEGESLAGTLTARGRSMEITGNREATATADESDSEEEPTVSAAELDEVLALYQGPVRRLDGFAVTNARVHPVSSAVLEDATVVVQNGKIVAVGTDVTIPEGLEVFDAMGGSLIPGIIDAHSHIAGEGGLNEGTLAVSAMVSVRDVIDPDDINIYWALAGGVTTVNVLHGSSNPIGGQNAVIKLRWGSDATGLLLEGAPPGIKFALGENPKRSNRTPRPGVVARYPKTRMGVMDVIRQAFLEARIYQAEWQEYRAQTGKQRGLPPRRDFEMDALVEILEGRRLVHAHSYRADEILQLLRLAEEFGFRIATLQHVLEGYKVADEIAAHGAGASTFSDWWGYKVEALDAIPHNAALMTERGVLVSINSDSGEEMRHLNQEAAKTMRWGGLSENEALALVTLNPAKQLGIAEQVGSIEVGKDADLTLYDGPPMSVFSVVQKTFVDGDLYFDLEADRQRQARVDEIKERLLGTEDEAVAEEAGEGITEGESAEEETADDEAVPESEPDPADVAEQLRVTRVERTIR